MSLYVEGDVPFISSGNGNGNGGWDNGWWIILLALLIGNRGGYGLGGSSGGGSEFVGYQLGKGATQADVASGFNNSAVLSGINDLKLANAQGFSGLNSAIANSTSTLGYNMLQGFHGVDNAICSLGYNLTHQISDCCCGVKSAIADLKYSNEAQTCQILTSQANQTQRILDYLTNDKIETLNRKLAVAEGQISNNAQSRYIVDTVIERLSPCPKPAYYVPNPNCCYSPCGATTNTIIQ